MRLEFLSREATDSLAKSVADNLAAYRSGVTRPLVSVDHIHASRVETSDAPKLLNPDGTVKPDAETAQLVFQWLSSLSPVQASDERLWVLLTHREFADYVHLRWRAGLEGSTRPEDRVFDRWFFRGSGVATFVRNGISRLWWFGYLTYDETRANPFELTNVLLSLQDIQVAFLERSLGRCRPVLRAVLEAVKKHEDALKNTPGAGEVIQGWAKEIRLYGGAYLLDAVPPERLSFVVEQRLRSKLR